MLPKFNPIEAIRSRPTFFLAAGLIVVMVIGLLLAFNPKPVNQSTATFGTNLNYEASSSLEHKVPPVYRFPPGMGVSNPATLNPGRQLPSLSIHVNLAPDTNTPPLGVYAPVGRLIQCQLVHTIDSGASDTPIIGLVTEDLWHQGRLVVPAGSEVHGRAQVDTLRERIISSGTWAIVRQTGEELIVTGTALDREQNGRRGSWGLTDGSPGLVGQVIRSRSLAEIKLFAATFLSGMASGLQQSQSTPYGTQIPGTARNGALNGTSQVLNSYAQQILETIKREGIFVRVPAGKEFYLYVTETIDLSLSKTGNARTANWSTPNTGNTHPPKP